MADSGNSEAAPGKAVDSSVPAEAGPAATPRSRGERSLAARRSRSPTGALSFTPFPRKLKTTVWTPERQRAFIDALAASGSVKRACAAIGASYANIHKLRKYPGAESFVAAWDAAIAAASGRIRDVFLDQVEHGVPEDVYHAGKLVGTRRRFNHRSMMWVLQHHMPEAYGGGAGGFAKRKATALDPWGNEVDAEVAEDLHARRRVRIGLMELAGRMGILI